MKDNNALTIHSAQHRGSAWERASGYFKQERPARSVSKIEVRGAVDVVFFQASAAQLIVAGENEDAINLIKTRYEGNTLVIEHEGITLSGGNGSINISGHGISISGGSINVSGSGSINMQINGGSGQINVATGRCIVGIAMSEAPRIKIKGSGDVALYGLQQALLEVSIQGSGDITATGQVDRLEAEVSGSGDVDMSELRATTARLSVAGSGDIEAFVTSSVRARVAGSGDIVVRGNPADRDHSVAGSGKVKFK